MTMHGRSQENSRNHNAQLRMLLSLDKEVWKWV
jgi:hypothetical protein